MSSPGEKFCNCSEQFGKRAGVPLLRQREVQLNEHEDGSRQGKDVAQVDDVVAPVRPSVSQVQDLKGKPAGVRREGKDGNEVKRRPFFRMLASCTADGGG